MRAGTIAALLTLVIVTAACAKKDETSPPDKSTTIRFGYFPIAYMTPLFVAVEKGFFAEAGLTVELKDIRGGPQVIAGIASGDLDGGSVSFLATVMARRKGVPLRIVASFGHSAPGEDTQGIAVLKKSGITSLEQLSGKTVGAMMKGTEPWFHTVSALKTHGVADYRYVELRQEEIPPALKSGTVAAGNLGEPFVTMMGDDVVLIHKFRNISGASGYSFSEQFIKEHPEAIKAFLGALGKAVAFARDNNAEARTILSKYTKLPPPVVQKVVLPSWDEKGRILVDEADKMLNWQVSFGLAEKKTPLDQIFNFDFAGKTTLDELYPAPSQ